MGGMGEVYRARDLTLSRDVALKVLPESLFPDIARLKRFQQEALAVSALNIVSVFDFAENDGSPYVIHELLSGDTLRTVLKGGPLPFEEMSGSGWADCCRARGSARGGNHTPRHQT